jgi:hypothetical protein
MTDLFQKEGVTMVTLRGMVRSVVWPLLLLMTSYAFQGCGSRHSEVYSLALAVPSNLSATISTSQIGLSWSASTDTAGIAGYNIYRDGLYLESSATSAALDSGATGSTAHCYTVSAYDAAGNESAQSTPLCTTATSTAINGQCTVVPATATGLIGVVLRGPIMPVCLGIDPCDAPFCAGFQLKKDGVAIGAFRSNTDGCFAMQVASGNYDVVPDADAPVLSPGSQTQSVTIGPDGWTQVQLTFDTGIR